MAGRCAPVAVVGRGTTITARLLSSLTGLPVEELTPYQAAMDGGHTHYRAVVVENFDHYDRRALSPCGAVRWGMAPAEVTVVGLDDGEGLRFAAHRPGAVYAYSDGRPQADLVAEQVRLRGDRLEFVALAGRDLARVRVGVHDRPRLYDCLAALAGALALGVPLEQAAARLTEAMS